MEKKMQIRGENVSQRLPQASAKWAYHRHEIIDFKAGNEIMQCQILITIIRYAYLTKTYNEEFDKFPSTDVT